MTVDVQAIFYIVGIIFMLIAAGFLAGLIAVAISLKRAIDKFPNNLLRGLLLFLQRNRGGVGGVLGLAVSSFLIRKLRQVLRS